MFLKAGQIITLGSNSNTREKWKYHYFSIYFTNHYFSGFLKKFYLFFESESYRDRDMTDKQKIFHLLAHSQMAIIPRVGPRQSQELGVSLSPTSQGHTYATFSCLSQVIAGSWNGSGAGWTWTGTFMGHWYCRLYISCHSTSLQYHYFS